MPREGDERDPCHFLGHYEVDCYLRNFYDAFELFNVIKLNTRVVCVTSSMVLTMQGPKEGNGRGLADLE
jgi:hypothetical protein